jgi:hypothetical protein
VTTITYRRAGGRPPTDDERLRIDADGTYSLVRTVAAEAVGRFGGQLPEGSPDLQALATAVLSAGDLDLRIPPDAPVERISVGERSAVLPTSAEPSAPWGSLVAGLRLLLREGQRQPLAALVLESDGPDHVRLRHAGPEPLDLDLSGLVIRGIVWEGNRVVDRSHWNFDEGVVHAETGWRTELDLAPPLHLTDEHFVVFSADLRIQRDGFPLPVRVTRNCHPDAPVMPIA